MSKYDHRKIEKKWQKNWAKSKIFKTKDPAVSTGEKSGKPKFYVLDMFPYPSGAGLHVGHPRGYIATDIVARMKMMQGYNVLHPMGWDAFGLPAENYAIKNKVHPAIATAKNIETFKKQLGLFGFTYDWDREVATTDPAYYKWTQWVFVKMFKHGLVYESYEPINWCPDCKTGLANEDLEGGLCERCGSRVEQKPMRQWVLGITKYADRLLKDLEKLPEWPESIKTMQRDWIGRSEGAEINFAVKDTNYTFTVFTTRPDTLFGATYTVFAPEHKLLEKLKSKIANWPEVEKYLSSAVKKTALERTDLAKAKTGVELKGVKAVNPVNGESLPVFVADYVLASYGTGAIMAVPAHDERDWEFAKKYGLPIKEVVIQKVIDEHDPPQAGAKAERAFTGDGVAVNSGFLNDLTTAEAKTRMIAWLEEKNFGVKKVRYKLRDWVFSRQRYWGEPIPLVRCDGCAKKKPKILLIHGIYGNSKENWFPWLKKQMEDKGYEVLAPDLPDGKYTNLEEWLNFLKNLNLQKDDNLSVIGHSLGAPAACQFILQNKLPVEKLILVAPTGRSQDETNWNNLRAVGCSEEGLRIIQAFNSENKNLDKLNALVKESVIYLSDNDPFIPLTVKDDYKDLKSEVIEFHNKGHFNHRAGLFEFPDVKEFNPGWIPIPEKDLPLKLPNVKKYEPSGTGESPLATIDKWVNTKCPVCKGPAKRETNTMPQWAGSCWYYLRYIDPRNKKALVDKNKEKHWSPVDLYVGGAEHATRHLIYARFWHKFLYDIGAVAYEEPFTRLQNVGLILAEDGRKMSKRWNNVINPDDIVEKYGADSMRLYEMFMGPFDQTCAWNTQGLVGMRRFLERVWNILDRLENKKNEAPLRLSHQTIKKVTDDIAGLRYNTAIAQMMTMVNEIGKAEKVDKNIYRSFIQLLAPFAPHLAEEIWNVLGEKTSIFHSSWPVYDAALAKDRQIQLVVQVNGKVRDTITVSADIGESEAKAAALASEKARQWLGGREPKKVIYIQGRVVSIVA